MLGEAAPRASGRTIIAFPALEMGLLRQLMVALLTAALLETALLRLFTRVSVHLPKDEALRGLFHGASFLGSLAFNFASILTIALSVLLLASFVAGLRSSAGRLALGILAFAMLSGLGLSLTTGAPTADALFGTAMTLLVVLVGRVLIGSREAPLARRAALALIVAAYLCYQYYALGDLIYRLLDYTTAPPLSATVLRVGEGLVVLAGGAVFMGWGLERWRRAGLAGAALVTLALVAVTFAALSPTSTPAILTLWTTGLTLFLPLPLYLVSLGLFLITLVACWRSGDSFGIVAGLILILVAGYMPEATYYHLLLLLGVASISGALTQAVTSSQRAAPDVGA